MGDSYESRQWAVGSVVARLSCCHTPKEVAPSTFINRSAAPAAWGIIVNYNSDIHHRRSIRLKG